MNKPSTKVIFAITIGNALEWYDFIVYSFMTIFIADLFFPSHSQITSLLAATATFGVAFCVRPLGSIVLGLYADRHGRKKAMTVIIALMSIALLIIVCVPTYKQIGIAAPALILFARLLQGFSAGGEFGASTSMLIESSPESQRGYYCSLQQASQILAALLGAVVSGLLTHFLSQAQMQTWGWRVPFALGLLIAPVGFYIRQHFAEDEFPNSSLSSSTQQLKNYFPQLLVGTGLVVGGTVSTYINFLYMPTYAAKQLHLPLSLSSFALFLGILPMLVGIPLFGYLSDRIGKKLILIVSISLYLLLIYPLFAWLCDQPTILKLIIIQSVFCILLSAYFGVFAVTVAELFPKNIRSTALSISNSLGTTLFGGFAQFIVTWLLMMTAKPIAITYYLIFAIAISLIAAIFYQEKGMPSEYA